jgi:hypothetical protein
MKHDKEMLEKIELFTNMTKAKKANDEKNRQVF